MQKVHLCWNRSVCGGGRWMCSCFSEESLPSQADFHSLVPWDNDLNLKLKPVLCWKKRTMGRRHWKSICNYNPDDFIFLATAPQGNTFPPIYFLFKLLLLLGSPALLGGGGWTCGNVRGSGGNRGTDTANTFDLDRFPEVWDFQNIIHFEMNIQLLWFLKVNPWFSVLKEGEKEVGNIKIVHKVDGAWLNVCLWTSFYNYLLG